MKISIEGSIGAGKTTVCSKLQELTRFPLFLEPVNEWTPYLNEFYKNPTKYSFCFNLKVLLSFQQWKDNNFKALYERSPISCHYVFCKQQIQDGHMNNLEYDVFKNIYEQISWTPDVIIYIRTDPKVCMQRIHTRSRECELSITQKYLDSIHEKYESLMENINNNNTFKKIKLFTIDGNQSQDEVVKQAHNIIKILN